MTPEILDTPIGRFYATPTKPGHAELIPVSPEPIRIHGVPYIVRGEFRTSEQWRGWERNTRYELDGLFAIHAGGYSICRHVDGGRYGRCGYGDVTDKARLAIARALGPALAAFLSRPEVRDDCRLNERRAAAAKWSGRARYHREEAERLLEKARKLDEGAAAILAGGDMAEPPYWLVDR